MSSKALPPSRSDRNVPSATKISHAVPSQKPSTPLGRRNPNPDRTRVFQSFHFCHPSFSPHLFLGRPRLLDDFNNLVNYAGIRKLLHVSLCHGNQNEKECEDGFGGYIMWVPRKRKEGWLVATRLESLNLPSMYHPVGPLLRLESFLKCGA